MSFEHFAPALAMVGLVIIVASLLSGLAERSGLPLVAIFLALGAALGPSGLNVVDLAIDSPALQVIATLALVLVLFTDAIAVDIAQVRRQRLLSVLVLGPGTVIPAALIAFAAWLLLDIHPYAAAILGAALASTDPVLLRSLLRRPVLPPVAKLALRLESGMNDVVLLPIVVLSMVALGMSHGVDTDHLGRRIVGLFLLGPALGVLAGYCAISLLDKVRAHTGVRRDYESLYALGVAFTAFALAESVGGSGFLAAFAAGLTIAALDVELCDCFLDYGEATSEMFLLLTFVAFGASLIWTGLEVVNARTLIFAVIALAVRTLVLLPVLRRAGVEHRSARIIAWLGPRGLSSLLLVLLPVFAGVPGAEGLFSIVCLVVLISVVVHGLGIAMLLRDSHAGAGPSDGAVARTALTTANVDQGASDNTPASTLRPTPASEAPTDSTAERISLEEFQRLRASGQPMIVADVRTDRSYGTDGLRGQGAIRLPPDDARAEARRRHLPRDIPLILYCT